MEKYISAEEAVKIIKSKDKVFVHGSAATPVVLLKALEQNPQGIDPNYFYADYLAGKRDWAEALRYLEIAKAAQPRPGRESADAGRQQEIAALLAKVQKKLKK